MLSRQILRAIPKNVVASTRAAHTDKEFAGLDYYRIKEHGVFNLFSVLESQRNQVKNAPNRAKPNLAPHSWLRSVSARRTSSNRPTCSAPHWLQSPPGPAPTTSGASSPPLPQPNLSWPWPRSRLTCRAFQKVLVFKMSIFTQISIKGKTSLFKWRGKPVFIKHRSGEDIDREASVNVGELRDPEADADRVKDPSWLVVVGICTHLGCVPIANAGEFCRC